MGVINSREGIDKNTEGIIRLEGKLESVQTNLEELKKNLKSKENKDDKVLRILGSIEYRQGTLQNTIETMAKHVDNDNHEKVVMHNLITLLNNVSTADPIIRLVVNSETYQKKRKEDSKEHWESVEGIISKRILKWFFVAVTTPIVIFYVTRTFIGS
jgi:chromosome segregation ATPase